MKYLFASLLLFIFTTNATYAQQISYPEWQKEVDTNSRLLPKYGGVSKNEAQIKADKDFVSAAIAASGSARKASDYFVKIGFDQLVKGNPKEAIYNFNQAWLLDPTNENSFWGFGGVYFYFKDHELALAQYTEGLVLNPKSANIMIDMATIGMARYSTTKDLNELEAPISLLKRAYDIDPNNQTMLAKLSACYFLKNDCEQARKYYEECKKLGGRTLTDSYTKALAAKCKD